MIQRLQTSPIPHRTYVTPMPTQAPATPTNPLFELSERLSQGPVKLSEILKVVQQIHDCGGEAPQICS